MNAVDQQHFEGLCEVTNNNDKPDSVPPFN